LVISRTRLETQQLQHFGGQFISAAVGGKAQLHVGLHRIQAMVLQFIGLQLGHQADPAALLLLVEQNAGALLGDLASASSNCRRQSQRSEPKTSPVRHCEWMRTSGGAA
jgi:hypothetical protein